MDEEYINFKISALEKEIRALQRKLASYPPGLLKCEANGNYTKWYILEKQKPGVKATRTYLPKKKIQMARTLALKTYQTLLIQDYQDEIRHWKQQLPKEPRWIPGKRTEALISNQSFRILLPRDIRSFGEELEEWQKHRDPADNLPGDDRRMTAEAGEKFPSESETLIADLLFENRIPYRFSPEFCLYGDRRRSPSFLTLNPYTRREIPWEHILLPGKGDMTEMLEDYVRAGYTPMVNLILTFESELHPLSRRQVLRIIDSFLR